MPSGVDDGEPGVVGESGVAGYGLEPEDGFLVSGDDGDGGLLGLCPFEELWGVGRDAEGHRGGGGGGRCAVGVGGLERFFECGEGFGGGVFSDEAGLFRAESEGGDLGGLVDGIPMAVGGLGHDGEEDGVRPDVDDGFCHRWSLDLVWRTVLGLSGGWGCDVGIGEGRVCR